MCCENGASMIELIFQSKLETFNHFMNLQYFLYIVTQGNTKKYPLHR